MMRGFVLKCRVSILAVFAFVVHAQAGSTSDALITVMNPAMPSKLAKRIPLAKRLDTLEGKTVYLVDIQWGGPEGGYSVLEELTR